MHLQSEELVKPEKCFPSKLWMNRGLGQEVGREKQGDERAGEGFQRSCVRVRQGRAWGVAQLWASHGTRVGQGPPVAGCQKSICPIGKS